MWVAAAFALLLFVVLALLGAFSYLMYATVRILKRQASFWWQAGPILLAYHWSLRKLRTGEPLEEEEQRMLERLHEEYAPRALEIVQNMGGMFLKMAQVAANNVMIPMAYRRQFSKCCDQNIPMDFQHVRKEIEAAMRAGRPSKSASRKLEDIFSHFDHTPLGVASIGQVHRARVAKDLREVAIKVKFPDVEELFMADFASLKVLARLARATWAVSLIEEFSRQISQEFNYQEEAENIDCMRAVLMPKFEDRLEVPGVCRELTTDNVLTMTFVEGTRLDRALKQRLQQAGLDTASLERAATLQGGPGAGQGILPHDGIEEGVGGEAVHTAGTGTSGEARQWGRLSRLSERTSGLTLDVLLAALRCRSRLDQCFAGLRRGRQANEHSSEAAEALARADVRAVLGTLLDVWGYSMLQVGTFHADPHPGNVLLQPGGTLGLLDFGQVKTLPARTQQHLAELIVAVADDNDAAMIESVRRLGFEMQAEEVVPAKAAAAPDAEAAGTADGAPEPAAAAAVAAEPPHQSPEVEFAKDVFGGAFPNIEQRMRMIQSFRQAPPDMFFVIRCAVILKGLGLGLGHRVDLAVSWRKWAKAFLHQGVPDAGEEVVGQEPEQEP